MYVKKQIVADAMLAGIPVANRVIAKVGHNKRFITLRHPWPEGTDGRVWHGIRNAFLAYAREISTKYRRQVEVRAVDGSTLAVVNTEDSHGIDAA